MLPKEGLCLRRLQFLWTKTQCNVVLAVEKKLASFKKNGVTTIHLSTCTRGKNDNYESIARQCAAAGFDVVGYTHGGAVSKDGKVAIELVGESNN